MTSSAHGRYLFSEMADALEGKIISLADVQTCTRRFASDVSHELRTPLTGVDAEECLLHDHLAQLTREVRRLARLLISDAGQLGSLVEEPLIEISGLDAGSDPVGLESVYVLAVVPAVLQVLYWTDHVELRGDGLEVFGDPRRLKRFVANKVGYAIKHSGRGVAVLAGADGDHAFVEVTDVGPEMAPAHLPHLFERFYEGRSCPGQRRQLSRTSDRLGERAPTRRRNRRRQPTRSRVALLLERPGASGRWVGAPDSDGR